MKELTILINVYKDQNLASTRIPILRQFYPNSTIVSISDGVENIEYEKICYKYDIEYFVGDRLLVVNDNGSSAEWIYRMFNCCRTDYLLKLDPDTLPITPMKSLPTGADIYGRIYSNKIGRLNIQMSCVLFTYDCINKILESDIFENKKYNDIEFTWKRFSKLYLRKNEELENVRLYGYDSIIKDLADNLQLKILPFENTQILNYYEFNKDTIIDKNTYFFHPCYEYTISNNRLL